MQNNQETEYTKTQNNKRSQTGFSENTQSTLKRNEIRPRTWTEPSIVDRYDICPRKVWACSFNPGCFTDRSHGASRTCRHRRAHVRLAYHTRGRRQLITPLIDCVRSLAAGIPTRAAANSIIVGGP